MCSINQLISFLARAWLAVSLWSAHPCLGGEAFSGYPDLPKPLTSFGATHYAGYVYVYGGHTGKAHHYTIETTLSDFMRLRDDGQDEWQQLPSDVRSQGCSLLGYNDSIYRVGGMAPFHSDEKEDEILRSLDDFARFDILGGQWKSLPPMPEPRSSHDSVIVNGVLYVVGGWRLAGDRDSGEWINAMYAVRLSGEHSEWKTIPQPFKKRAVAVAALGHRIYVMGGMDSENDPSTSVDIFDTVSGKWSSFASLPDGPMMGFGAAACATGDGIIVSPYAGTVLQSTSGFDQWIQLGELVERRFFHRMVAIDSTTLLAIGGASRQSGHLASIEVFRLDKATGSH